MDVKKYWWQLIGFAFIVILMNQLISNYIAFGKLLGTILRLFQPFIIAFVFAYMLYPLVKAIETKVLKKLMPNVRQEIRYWLSIFISYMLFIGIAVIFIAWLIPIVFDNLKLVSPSLIDEYIENARGLFNDFQQTFSFLKNIDFVEIMDGFVSSLFNVFSSQNIRSYLQQIISFTSVLYVWVMGIIISIYMLVERESLFKSTSKFFSLFIVESKLNHIKSYIHKVNHVFIKFFFGKALDSFIIGILAAIGFYFLNVPLFLVMAFVIMVTNMIPYFGPFIGGIPVTLLTLVITQDFLAAFWVGLFILALQQFDGLYLGPKILGDSVGVSAFWVIASITLGGAMFGFVGLLLCVPIAATIRMLFNDYYDYKKNKHLALEDGD